MIALFTGARINAAITLQYKDILVKDGIAYIQFRSDHKIKQLKMMLPNAWCLFINSCLT